MDYQTLEVDEIVALIKQSVKLTSRQEGSVHYHKEKQIVIKARRVCSGYGVEDHEYNVAQKLHSICQDHIACYLALIKSRDIAYFIIRHVPGESLASLRKKLTRKDSNILHLHILFVLLEIQKAVRFTHYDLTSSNIIVETVTSTTYHYSFFGKSFRIHSPYKITLIDFATSYVDGLMMGDHWTEAAYLSFVGVTPSVYDDLYDIIVLISHLLYLRDERSLSIRYLVRRAGFFLQEDVDDISNIGRECPDLQIIDSEIIRTWSDQKPGYFWTGAATDLTLDDPSSIEGQKKISALMTDNKQKKIKDRSVVQEKLVMEILAYLGYEGSS